MKLTIEHLHSVMQRARIAATMPLTGGRATPELLRVVERELKEIEDLCERAVLESHQGAARDVVILEDSDGIDYVS